MLKKNWKKILIILTLIIISASVGAYADYLLTASDVLYGSTSVKAALDDLYAKAPKFTIGQLVTYNSEPFYVLSESADKVELFAKTNLNTDATAQANAAYGLTKCVFSSTNSYWSSLWSSGTRINLNNINGFTDTDAIGKARKYARLKGAISGRLLTYEEANTLKNSYSDMIYGKGNTTQNYEYYWLGSAREDYNFNVWYVNGGVADLDRDGYDRRGGGGAGVRPVLTVYKSDVQ